MAATTQQRKPKQQPIFPSGDLRPDTLAVLNQPGSFTGETLGRFEQGADGRLLPVPEPAAVATMTDMRQPAPFGQPQAAPANFTPPAETPESRWSKIGNLLKSALPHAADFLQGAGAGARQPDFLSAAGAAAGATASLPFQRAMEGAEYQKAQADYEKTVADTDRARSGAQYDESRRRKTEVETAGLQKEQDLNLAEREQIRKEQDSATRRAAAIEQANVARFEAILKDVQGRTAKLNLEHLPEEKRIEMEGSKLKNDIAMAEKEFMQQKVKAGIPAAQAARELAETQRAYAQTAQIREITSQLDEKLSMAREGLNQEWMRVQAYMTGQQSGARYRPFVAAMQIDRMVADGLRAFDERLSVTTDETEQAAILAEKKVFMNKADTLRGAIMQLTNRQQGPSAGGVLAPGGSPVMPGGRYAPGSDPLGLGR